MKLTEGKLDEGGNRSRSNSEIKIDADWSTQYTPVHRGHSTTMTLLNAKQREQCWQARDRYLECKNSGNKECDELMALFKEACPAVWVILITELLG